MLRGTQSLPARYSHSTPDWADGRGCKELALDMQQVAKGTPHNDGITPKSVFGWQPRSGTASPTTPSHSYLDSGMRYGFIGLLHIQAANNLYSLTTKCNPMYRCSMSCLCLSLGWY